MTDKQLTAEEAEQFLELYEKLLADMETMFEEANFASESNPQFEETWGAPEAEAYVWYTRNKYRRFIEHAYLDADGDDAD